jgi:hypothetical protein
MLNTLIVAVYLDSEPFSLTGIHFWITSRAHLRLSRLQNEDACSSKRGNVGQMLVNGIARLSIRVVIVVRVKIDACRFL